MQKKVNKVFEISSPFRLCKDFNINMHEKEKESYFIRPFKAIKNSLFVGHSCFIDFQGNGMTNVELVKHLHSCTYEKAIEILVDKYKHGLSSKDISSIRWSSRSVACYMELLEKAKAFFAKSAFNLSRDDNLCKAKSFLSNKDIPPHVFNSLVGACTGKDLNEFMQPLLDSNLFTQGQSKPGVKKPKDNHTFLVFPYYVNHAVLSEFEILDLDSLKIRYFKFMDSNYSVFGLKNLTPDKHAAVLLPSSFDVLSSYDTLVKHANLKNNIGISLKLYDSFKVVNPPLPRAIYLKDDDTKVADLVKKQVAVADLKVCNKKYLSNLYFKSLEDSKNTIIDEVEKTLSDKSLSKEKKLEQLSFVKENKDLLEYLKFRLSDNPENISLLEIGKHGKQIFEMSGYKIYSTGDGYFAKKNRYNTVSQFTNFTITLDRCVVFKNKEDIIYTGSAQLKDISFDIMLTKKQISRARDIVSACIYSVTDSNEAVTEVPTLIDESFGRQLRNIISQQIRNCSIIQGLPKMGWYSNKFYSRHWMVDELGLRKHNLVIHPSFSSLHVFNTSQDIQESKALTLGLPEVCNFICAVSASMFRSFNGVASCPVFIKSSENNLRIARALLDIFGQRKILSLHKNARRHENYLNDIAGIPLILSCDNIKKIKGIEQPCVAVVEDGINFAMSADQELLTRLKLISHSLFPELISQILKTQGTTDLYFRDGATLETSITEGKEMLQNFIPEFYARIEPKKAKVTKQVSKMMDASPTKGVSITHKHTAL
jgi:hypothetical protein